MTAEHPTFPGSRLRRVLRSDAGQNFAEGEYSPLRNERTLTLGVDHRSPVARMTAFHEAYHSILNGCTTFGVGMVLAGAIQEAGSAGFPDLVDKMIAAALTTHETYATICSIYSAADGSYDRTLLDDYPYYQALYDRVASVLDLNELPFVTSVCIPEAARVAMQTTLLDTWLNLPCAAWPDTFWTAGQTPDHRFDVLMQPSVAKRARDAVIEALQQSPSPLRRIGETGISPATVTNLVAQTTPEMLIRINRAAFDVFADELGARGIPVPEFDGQRLIAREISSRVVAQMGDRLKTDFHVPADLAADRLSILVDFRRERIVYRPAGQHLHVELLEDVDAEVPSRFVLQQEDLRYVQLVAAPLEKVYRLYGSAGDFWALDGCGEVLTGLRRRVGGPTNAIEILRLPQPQDLADFLDANHGITVYAFVCASVLYQTPWAKAWFFHKTAKIDFIAVSIDIDPFELISHLAKQGPLSLFTATLLWDEPGAPERIEAMAIATDERPTVIHFSPCSPALMDAMCDYVRIAEPNARIGGHLSKLQGHILSLALSHAVREEPMFGFNFWD